MKQEIKYKVTDELREVIARWCGWLKDERRYSLHTLDAYTRDLAGFFEYLRQSRQKDTALKDLNRLSVRDFRGYIADRAAHYKDKATLARNISTLKNFFKWLNRQKIIENSAIGVISAPKQPKVLPRALEIDDTLRVIGEIGKKEKKHGRAKGYGGSHAALRLRPAYLRIPVIKF